MFLGQKEEKLESRLNAETKCIIDRDEAKILAKPYGRFDEDGIFDPAKIPQKDPFATGRGKIPASLLSSEQIIKYVEITGLIAPFYTGGGRISLLKDASYEGRIGEKAFIFKADEKKPTQVFSKNDKILKVPANSIVFVECDLDFRIPDFIALRFNLQIRHVHRGLLLGTGPLIDPGYWGKLCIPLHNLTDEDYEIPSEEGLIWIEFTKTSGAISENGRPPLGKEFWDIREFITKASDSLIYGAQKRVGIRSSIPAVVMQAKSDSEKALKNVEQVVSRAEEAEKAVQILEAAVTKRLNIYGWAGFFGVFIGLSSLLYSLHSLTQSYNLGVNRQFEVLAPQIRKLRTDMDEHIDSIDKVSNSTPEEFDDERNELKNVIENLLEQNSELLRRIEKDVYRAENPIIE